MNIDKKNFLFSVLDFIPIGVCVINENYEVIAWNHTLATWSEKAPQEVEGKNLFSLYPHLNNPKFIERFNHVFEGSPPAFFSSKIHKYLIPCGLDNDQFRIQNCTFSRIPIRDDDLSKMGLLSIQDVTDLEKNIMKVKRSSKEKEEFLNMCSHDLRSPLNAVIGLAHILKDEEVSNDEKVEYSGMIYDSGKMMLELINNLLDLSKMGQLKKKNLTEVDFVECALKSFSFHKHLADKKNISYMIDTQTNGKVLALSNELIRSMNNLISNAIKFTPSGGTVKISLFEEDANVVFSVEDSGTGIEKENIENLFVKYTKSHKEGTDGEVGTGLGLSITKKIVDRFNGSIVVSSEINRGSKFSIIIPRT